MSIYKADADGVSIDGATTYQGYVRTRALPPSGQDSQRSHLRQAVLVARRQSGVSVRCTITGELGERTATGDALLTPAASETRVIVGFDDLQDADLRFAQLTLGDAAAADVTWAFEHLNVNVSEDGEA
jgi:hypothetical protein